MEKELLRFLAEDDLEFYEQFLVQLSDDEVEWFFCENPEFLKEYRVNKERRALLRDKMYREILKRIQEK